MGHDERIRELASMGVSASAIAVELHISRQRVYQIAGRAGVKFGYPPDAQVCRPHLLTGGIAQPLNSSVTGKVSELLVAADLLARGWQVFLPVIATKGHDLVATHRDRVITIEAR